MAGGARRDRRPALRAALLCCGPSLEQTYRDGHGFDLVVAVNEAAARWRTPHWWAAIDEGVIREYADRVAPCKLLTNETTRGKLQAAGNPWGLAEGLTTDGLRTTCPVDGWTLYTATSSLVLLYGLGVTEVQAFGVDWTPEPGNPKRDAARFASERVVWDRMRAWLDDRGMTVNRNVV